MRRRVIELVGWPSDEELASLWGRRSGLRERACVRGLGQHLPDLPPAARDASLRYVVADEVHLVTGHPARPFEAFARDFAQVFGGEVIQAA